MLMPVLGRTNPPVAQLVVRSEPPARCAGRLRTTAGADQGAQSGPVPTGIKVRFTVEHGAQEAARLLGRGWRGRLAVTARELWQGEQAGQRGEIGIILVGTDRIRALNRAFRGKDRPTDVLSFDLSDASDVVEGEVYIGVDVARRQAGEFGGTVPEEVARLLIHGLLHLAGYDHHAPAEGRRMAAATRGWLARWQVRASRG